MRDKENQPQMNTDETDIEPSVLICPTRFGLWLISLPLDDRKPWAANGLEKDQGFRVSQDFQAEDPFAS
jgi:hypothetical protein